MTVTVALRWPILLRSGWQDTVVQLPEGRWRDAFTGAEIDGGEQRVAGGAPRGSGRPSGAHVTTRRISVWAPDAKQVELLLGDDRKRMEESGGGWFACNAEVAADDDYAFGVDGE